MILFLFLAALVGLFYYYSTKNYGYWKKRNIPGPEPSIFVGTFPSIYDKRKHMADELDRIYKTYKGKEAVIGTYRAANPCLMILDPAIIKSIVITNFNHFRNQPAIFGEVDREADPIAGSNPFFLKDEEWREKRAEILPAFTSGRIKALFPIMEEVAERMKKFIANGNGHFETRELCAKYTTDVVASSIFGIEGGGFADENSPVRKIARDALSPNWRLFVIAFLSPAFPFILKILKVRFVPKESGDFLIKLLNDALDHRKKTNLVRQDYLDFLIHLRDKKGLSETEVAAHTVTFFFDGIETSSITMSYIFYELAKNPVAQQKLRSELAKIRKNDGSFEYDTLSDHKYLEQVVFESLRLNPITPELARECNDDIEIQLPKDKKVKIEKGLFVTFPYKNIQVDPEYYDEPLKFNPDRFNDENGGLKRFKDQMVLFPFGDGPRVCLGQRFALTQIKCAVAHVVSDFNITVAPDMPEKPEYNPMEIMMCYKSGILLNFKPINE